MVLKRFLIGRLVDILENLDDSAAVAIGVEEDFLVVRNLADLAVRLSEGAKRAR
jgi:hypothetical protein